ncbi:S9 family peptidase [Flavobacterium gillisiae]|nr:prolyl oligopeptidase family serine peptidase [Flavobacterium gillisiae]
MKKQNTIYRYKRKFFILNWLFLSVSCLLSGQVQMKKNLKEADYHLWNTLAVDQLSADGKWVSYSLEYPGISDTLFVKNKAKKTTYVIPSGYRGNFTEKQWFACLSSDGALHLINLKNGNKEVMPNVSSYAFLANGSYFAFIKKEKDQTSSLVIRNLEKTTTDTFTGVDQFSVSHKADKLVFNYKDKSKSIVKMLSFEKGYTNTIIAAAQCSGFYNLVWQQKDESIAFLKERSDSNGIKNEILFYSVKNDSLYSFIPEKEKDFPASMGIVNHDIMELTISDDGSKVFFGIKKQSYINLPETTDKVQVWNGNDKFLYPLAQQLEGNEKTAKIAVWFPKKKIYRQISTNELPWIMLTSKQNYAITANPAAYEPQYKMYGDMDYYITNIATGESTPWLRKQSGDVAQMGLSSNEKYICYYRDKNWWVYDIAKSTSSNLTKGMPMEWDNESLDPGNDITSFGNPGWTLDNELIVYDQFDIWIINPESGLKRRITKGREKNISFRLSKISSAEGSLLYNGRNSLTYDLTKQLVLTATGTVDGFKGYFLWSTKTAEKLLAYGSGAFDQLSKASSSETYVCRQMAFDKSPSLIILSAPDFDKQTFLETNVQQKNYYWGTSRMIHYSNSIGQSLNGALFYPANYDPMQKYPMVVYPYEKQSRDLFQYENPSMLNMGGFNVTNFTTRGYFVLLPDIIHVKGDTGISALDCVVAATQKVIDMGIIDKDKIGLTGHSFGGYETNFIITQTDIFAAAVSGAGVSDMVSWYLTMGNFKSKPDMWRSETQQWRMGKSFYDDQQAYYRNSPIVHASNIQTPVLLWSGKLDFQVDWHQNMEFYLALRRLGKKNIMLLYPDEGHAIFGLDNQIDITNKTQDWFDYYLKDKKAIEWINKGVAD